MFEIKKGSHYVNKKYNIIVLATSSNNGGYFDCTIVDSDNPAFVIGQECKDLIVSRFENRVAHDTLQRERAFIVYWEKQEEVGAKEAKAWNLLMNG